MQHVAVLFEKTVSEHPFDKNRNYPLAKKEGKKEGRKERRKEGKKLVNTLLTPCAG